MGTTVAAARALTVSTPLGPDAFQLTRLSGEEALSRLFTFQLDLLAYEREGEPCRKCRARIKRVVIGQRSSYYCPRCQR